jgi:hypothetical protein
MLEIDPLVLMHEVRKLFLELWSIHSSSLITSWICECKIPRFQAIRRHRRHSSSTTWNPHGVESGVGCNGITDCTTRHLHMECEACKVHKDEAIMRRQWSFLNKCEEKAWFLNRFTFVLVPTACASLQVLGEGRCIHAKNIQRGCECEILTASLTCMPNMVA